VIRQPRIGKRLALASPRHTARIANPSDVKFTALDLAPFGATRTAAPAGRAPEFGLAVMLLIRPPKRRSAWSNKPRLSVSALLRRLQECR
jgi:hypothetical protein